LLPAVTALLTGVYLFLYAEVFVRVDEVERRLFQVLVDDSSKVGKKMSVGGGWRDQ